jgi:PAS domain S-box-containing protein
MSRAARSFFSLFIPLTLLLGGIVALFYFQENKSRQMALEIKETSRLNTQKEVISSYIEAIATDVLTISKHYELRMMLDNNEPRYRKSLAKEFLWFSRIKKIYDQVRYIDGHGMEQLRVNFNSGAPAIVPLKDLQPKGERYYFKDTFQLTEGEVFVSPFDLNIEHGQIEQPIKPMIRFGTPVFDGRGNKRGIVLLNYLGSHLLKTLKAFSQRRIGNLLLLNSDGYFLCGPEQNDEWGFMYEDKKNRTFARVYPDAWQKLSRAEAGQFSDANGMYTFTTIRPFTEAQVSSTGSGEPYTPSEKALQGTEYYWKLVTHIPPGALEDENGIRLGRSLAIYAVMLVFSAFGSGFVAYASEKRRQAEDEVRHHRDYLKQLVDQRTAELINVNRQLQTDINERKQVERNLRESEEKYRSMMEAMDDAVYICSDDFRITYMNPAMLKRVGYNAVGERCSKVLHGLDGQCSWCVHQRVMKGEHVRTEVVSPKDNKFYQVSNSPIFHLDGSISKLTIFRDNTEVKKIEAQLQQARKLESVGRLAGGVAHDYNNALSVIIGFAELAINEATPDSPLWANLDEILKAAHNAADITRQLLAFARKQSVVPKILNLNANVENMLNMLRRLIGEDIDLAWIPGTGLWPILIDPSQLNLILVNLCVNARDAVKGVGKITIETKNTSFDDSYCEDHTGFTPGDFARLAVSDDGCGMDKQILENIFEPFFTTKTADKGTGLGLSTVYGIVKQNNGFINVYSEPGRGTTISIYLPRHEGKIAELPEIDTKDIPTGKGETIVLVEDDPSILRLAHKMLDLLGYNVLAANTPTEALRLAGEYTDTIHLLVTDVIMPEMDGRELSEKMVSLYPGIKHLFMSGYTADVTSHRGMLDNGVHLLQKPFSRKDLALAVRRALNEPQLEPTDMLRH